MTYADPGELAVSRMKPVAARLPAVVDARDASGFSRLMTRAATAKDLYALVEILAGAADPVRLAAVTGHQVPARLREAHAEFERLRKARLPRPEHVRAGERQYQAHVKRQRRERAAA